MTADTANDALADMALLARIVVKDADAIGELYDRHRRLLYGLILRILRDRSEAEEVLQEVFVLVWTRAETYDVALGVPIAWLVRLARNRAIDRLRANRVRLRAVETVAAPSPASGDPETRASQGEQEHAVARALGELPREQRDLIEEAYFLGLTQSELAARHQVPLGTVKTRMRSGLQLLRQKLSAVAGASHPFWFEGRRK
jgi:RNA polymerase sigma-70 factor (ECF subfamily)